MKLLFCTDLSEPPALTRQVEQMAERLEAHLLVLHVHAPAPSAGSADPAALTTAPEMGLSGLTPYAPYDPQMEAARERAEEEAFHDFLTERFRRPVRAALRGGDPARTILEDADEHDVDLIVLGKHRRGAIERLLLGSVGRKVLSKSERPTLFIPVSGTSGEET